MRGKATMRSTTTTTTPRSEESAMDVNISTQHYAHVVPVVKSVIQVGLSDRMSIVQQLPRSEEALCDDILSCISALDDVIAEFDDSISQSSSIQGVLGGEEVQVEVEKIVDLEADKNLPEISPDTRNGIGVISSHTYNSPHFNSGFYSSTPSSSELARVTCSVNSNSLPEPTVTIFQTHSQTVTEIQIGSSANPQPSQCQIRSNSNSRRNMSTNSNSSGKQSKPKPKSPTRQIPASTTKNEPLQLKQSHFSPVKAPDMPAKSQEIDPGPFEVKISSESCSPNGNFMSYGIIFPKVVPAAAAGTAAGTAAPIPDVVTPTAAAPPAPFPRARRSAAAVVKMTEKYQGSQGASKSVSVGGGGGGSFPKVKEHIYEVIAESQSVKFRPSPKSGAQKPMPLFITETTPAFEKAKEQKRAQLLKSEEWNFHSDDKLPRSLRKTRRTCLDEDEESDTSAGGGVTATSGNGMVTVTSSSSSSSLSQSQFKGEITDNDVANCSPIKAGTNIHSHAVQVQVKMSKKGFDNDDFEKDEGTNGPTTKMKTQRENADDIWKMPVTHIPAALQSQVQIQQSDHKSNTSFTRAVPSATGAGGSVRVEVPLPPPKDAKGFEKKIYNIKGKNDNGKNTYSKGTFGNENIGDGERPRGELPISGLFRSNINNGLQVTPSVLDVDDGYLSMINRHETPILWPEGFIESETFSPEELKTLSVQLGLHSADYDSKTRMSAATDKTDYFSDDSLEFEAEGDEPRTFIITGPNERRKSMADVQNSNSQKFDQEATCRKSWSFPSEQANRNVWRIGTPESSTNNNNSNSLPRDEMTSSPVRKPCAFFIPLNVSEVCESQVKASAAVAKDPDLEEALKKSLISPTESVSSPVFSQNSSHIFKNNSEAFIFDFSDPKTKEPKYSKESSPVKKSNNLLTRGTVHEFLDSILGKALKTGMQEADAINFLLASPDEDIPGTIASSLTAKQVLSVPMLGCENPIVITLEHLNDSEREGDEAMFTFLDAYSAASSEKIDFSLSSDVASPMTEISYVDLETALVEPISQISGFCSDEEGEVPHIMDHEVTPISENQDDIPQISMASASVITEKLITEAAKPKVDDEKKMKIMKEEVDISPTHSNADRVKFEIIEDLHDQPPPFVPAPPPISAVVCTIQEASIKEESSSSDDSFPSSPIHQDSFDFPLSDRRRPEKYFQSIPEEDYRAHIKRQTSRSHENLVDIVGRRYGYLSPTGSHGHSSTLPPNSVPPVHRRRSALRTFIDYFKRGKKVDLHTPTEQESFYAEAPGSPRGGKRLISNGHDSYPYNFPAQNLQHQLPEDLKISRTSINESPRGSQRSKNSGYNPVKKGVLSRIFRRKDK